MAIHPHGGAHARRGSHRLAQNDAPSRVCRDGHASHCMAFSTCDPSTNAPASVGLPPSDATETERHPEAQRQCWCRCDSIDNAHSGAHSDDGETKEMGGRSGPCQHHGVCGTSSQPKSWKDSTWVDEFNTIPLFGSNILVTSHCLYHDDTARRTP